MEIPFLKWKGGGDADDTVWGFSLLMTWAVKRRRKEQADVVKYASRNAVYV